MLLKHVTQSNYILVITLIMNTHIIKNTYYCNSDFHSTGFITRPFLLPQNYKTKIYKKFGVASKVKKF